MSFDNVGLAFVTLLQCVTFDDWTEVMYSLMVALSPYVVLYFVAFVALGGFFVINLFLAVVFEEHSAQQAELEAEQYAQRLLTEQLAEVGALQLARERNFSDSPMKLGDSPMKLAPVEEEEEEEGTAAWPRRALDLKAPAEEQSKAAALGQSQSLPAPSATDSQVHSDEADAAQALLLPSATSSDAIVTDEEKGAAAMSLMEQQQQQQFTAPDDASATCVGCAPVPGTFRHRLAEIMSSDGSGLVATVLVVINLVLMTMPYEGMSAEYASRLDDLSTTITWIFIGEMALKLYGLGCEGYWRDGWNRLDGTIVSISLFEMVLSALFADSGMNLSFLRILRMLRVARMLRLMRSWKGLYKIVSTFVKSIPAMANLFLLMLLFMFIFALLAMQLFGGMYNPQTGYSTEPCLQGRCPDPRLMEEPRYHFDYFVPALSSVFVLFTGEWVDAMVPAVGAVGLPAVFFFIFVVVIGRYLLINLLIAIVLSSFADDSDTPVFIEDGTVGELSAGTARAAGSRATTTRTAPGDDARADAVAFLEETSYSWTKYTWPQDYSFLCFSPRNPVRQACLMLVTSPLYDTVIIIAILVSSVCLALDSPRLDPEGPLAVGLHTLDMYFWPWLFGAELLIKAISFGFVYGEQPRAYLRSPWNQLDAVIVLASFLAIATEQFPALAPLANLRVLRVLRPLRLVSRSAGMRLIISSLAQALPSS
jgi:hypothetical protein